ncbi:FecR family protein [Sunxiuqinia sp. A32]|uniref:FecR family protein n=1 Tax=Sunxiuqinia sp. A32 TaxID=3461496 RepID=UPI00404618DA
MENNLNIEERFSQLIKKFQLGECSLNELYELETILEKEKSAVIVKNHMLQDLENRNFEFSEQISNEDVFKRVKEQIVKNQQNKQAKVLPLYVRVARVAAVIIASFVLGGAAVKFLESKPIPERIEYCEIVSPMGAQSQVILPDSSVVWLNADSRLRYSTNFNKAERNIELEGEGYFRIAKNKELPFIVDADGFLVEAVGTEFNVKAYKDEKTIETVLVEGKVRLDHKTESIAPNVYLNPRYRATFYKDASDAKLNNNQPRLVISPNVDPRPLISWKDGRFIFVSELLDDLALKLERKYNCKFMFESEDIKNYRFSGTLEDETLTQVMDVISSTAPISYKMNGKNVIINKDKNRTNIFKKH